MSLLLLWTGTGHTNYTAADIGTRFRWYGTTADGRAAPAIGISFALRSTDGVKNHSNAVSSLVINFSVTINNDGLAYAGGDSFDPQPINLDGPPYIEETP